MCHSTHYAPVTCGDRSEDARNLAQTERELGQKCDADFDVFPVQLEPQLARQ
jgi:hypothetical protein